MDDLVKLASDVIKIEAKGLNTLADSLGEDFSNAIDILKKCDGRVIFSGMGKSGHIGAKLAATMASTGTPAFFVHPGEASHGDLGMLKSNDVLVLLSNSGNTAELRDLITFAHRQNIPIVGISKSDRSLVGQASNVFLTLPDVEEACALHLAPTTSTTATLALGDALCVALMQLKGFEPGDFHRFHPGGRLGLDLLEVHELMRLPENVPTCPIDAPMTEVLDVMNAESLGLVALMVGSDVEGIITDGDIRRNSSIPIIEQKAADLMSRNPISVPENELATKALKVMNDRCVTALVVRNANGEFAGLLHIHELLRAGIG